MTLKNKMFQPGLALYEVVVGTFKSTGTTFSAWCKDAEINETVARNALTLPTAAKEKWYFQRGIVLHE